MFIETYKDSEVTAAIGELSKRISNMYVRVRRSGIEETLEELRNAVVFHPTHESSPPPGAEVVVRHLNRGDELYAVARFRDGKYRSDTDQSVLNATHWKYVNHIS